MDTRPEMNPAHLSIFDIGATDDELMRLFWPAVQVIEPEKKEEKKTLMERYAEFDSLNPHVWKSIERIAMSMLDRGFKRISIAMIFELLRYDYTVQTKGDSYKLSNNLKAFYARRLQAQPWMPEGRIELRQRKTP